MSSIKYKSKYSTKSLSVYGEPPRSFYYNLNKIIGNRKLDILIVDSLDGIDVLPLTLMDHSITCYETNKILIDGGDLDGFYSLGLKNRLKGAGKIQNVEIFNQNYDTSENKKKYDLVFVKRTLHLKHNSQINIISKVNKLKNAVKDNGLIYIFYYLKPSDNSNYPNSSYFQPGQMKTFFANNKWHVYYQRENVKRKTIHNAHPYNSKKHYHNCGVIFAKKLRDERVYVHKKRICKRTYKTASIYGNMARQLVDYNKFLKDKFGRNYNALLVDGNDGQNALYLARKGNIVDCYENNNVLLYGGLIDNYETLGLFQRMKDNNLSDRLNVYQTNFYLTKNIKKYDFVVAYRSLHFEKYEEVSLKKKVRKLMASTKEGGYLYIYYYLIDDFNKDFVNSKNRYFDEHEMRTYFDLKDWQILSIHEGNLDIKQPPHAFNNQSHTHRIGYIFARKYRDRKKYKYHYEYSIQNSFLNDL